MTEIDQAGKIELFYLLMFKNFFDFFVLMLKGSLSYLNDDQNR